MHGNEQYIYLNKLHELIIRKQIGNTCMIENKQYIYIIIRHVDELLLMLQLEYVVTLLEATAGSGSHSTRSSCNRVDAETDPRFIFDIGRGCLTIFQ